ncbi:hypothetical protein ACQ9BO_20000 [Flavobacterium sp. P21]|uniref:hypothetical protein n=1 Tax=Flavobacterium sp. P21 TaxID=3423948 RepID=UPI003D678D3E
MKIKPVVFLLIVSVLAVSCDYFSNPNDKMIKILDARKMMYNVKSNPFAAKAEVAYYDSIINSSDEGFFKLFNELNKGNALLKFGKEAESVSIMENAIKRKKRLMAKMIHKRLNVWQLLI